MESPDPLAERELAQLEQVRERVRNFLSATDLTFVCYASDVRPDGSIIGLDEDAEKRLYIEGNALNSQATKEEVIKYESFSPVIVALQEDRMEPANTWMDPEYIEEDSKVVGKNSTKLFTLSALAQAYSYAMLGDNDPISNLSSEMFRKVAERREFANAFWRGVSDAFCALWVPLDPERRAPLAGASRLEYLTARRQERNVAFQALFLHALGQLGFALGARHQWTPSEGLARALESLGSHDWRAYRGDDADGRDVSAYDMRLTLATMKPHLDRDNGAIDRYAFEHSSDKVRATERLLWSLLGYTD
jgi:hypothetical protein